MLAQKGEVTANYPLDLVWVDSSGNLVGTTPLEIGLVVPSTIYTLKLQNNITVPARQDLMKSIFIYCFVYCYCFILILCLAISNTIMDYQKKNPPAEPPPLSAAGGGYYFYYILI